MTARTTDSILITTYRKQVFKGHRNIWTDPGIEYSIDILYQYLVEADHSEALVLCQFLCSDHDIWNRNVTVKTHF